MADEIVGLLIRASAHMRTMDETDLREIIESAIDEIGRLRVAGDEMARWIALDHLPEHCEECCEYLVVLRAWEEARCG